MGDEIGLEAEQVPELGLVGNPLPSAPAAVVEALGAGRVPVVAPLARGPLNVNADEAAAMLAVGIGAERVHFVTDVPGLLIGDEVVASIHADEAEQLLAERRACRVGSSPSSRPRCMRPGGRRGGDRRDGGDRVSKLLETHLLPTYARAPVTFVEGDGCWLIDDNGERYLDFAGGIAVIGLGHRHPASTRAAHEQLDRLWHVSNLYWTVPMMELAKRLSDRFGGAAGLLLQLGRRGDRGGDQVRAQGDRQGRRSSRSRAPSTVARWAASRSPGSRPSARPSRLCSARSASPFLNDSLSLRAAALADTGLIIMEPIQGEGGVHPAEAEFLRTARALADELGALLCFDEVQTGVGRTGTFFGFESAGRRPDLVTLAKGLANGLPIGALLVADSALRGFEPGEHASTFGGNPVACAAACAVLDAIDEELLANVSAMGERLAARAARDSRRQRGARRRPADRRRGEMAPRPRSRRRRSSTGCSSPPAARARSG